MSSPRVRGSSPVRGKFFAEFQRMSDIRKRSSFPHQAKANIFFDVCLFFLDLFGFTSDFARCEWAPRHSFYYCA